MLDNRLAPVHHGHRWPRRVVAVGGPSLIVRDSAASFTLAGIELDLFGDAASALLSIGAERPAAVIVPTSISDVDLLGFVHAVAAFAAAPIFIGIDETDASHELAVRALDTGANAVVGMPLRCNELENALHLAGSRPATSHGVITVGSITLDHDAHRVLVDGRDVSFAPKEFQLLAILMSEHPRVVTAEHLSAVFEGSGDSTIAGVRVMVSRVRRKLGDASGRELPLLETVRGIGYRLAQ